MMKLNEIDRSNGQRSIEHLVYTIEDRRRRPDITLVAEYKCLLVCSFLRTGMAECTAGVK
jgi:hypothetical protein